VVRLMEGHTNTNPAVLLLLRRIWDSHDADHAMLCREETSSIRCRCRATDAALRASAAGGAIESRRRRKQACAWRRRVVVARAGAFLTTKPGPATEKGSARRLLRMTSSEKAKRCQSWGGCSSKRKCCRQIELRGKGLLKLASS
jgi:hypothetical protein